MLKKDTKVIANENINVNFVTRTFEKVIEVSELLKLVDTLEVKVHKTVEKLKLKEQKNRQLASEITLKDDKIAQQAQLLKNWEEKFNTLKLTSSMLGSDEYKRETKLKINTLIREIDSCITQLSK